MGVVLHTYPIMVNHTFNAMPTQRLQKHHLHFTMNRTDHTSHVGHSTILLRSENLSGKCAKLHIVAAGNDRDHTPWSLYYCLFMPHMFGCCSSRTSRSWWTTHLMQHQWRSCNITQLNVLGRDVRWN